MSTTGSTFEKIQRPPKDLWVYSRIFPDETWRPLEKIWVPQRYAGYARVDTDTTEDVGEGRGVLLKMTLPVRWTSP